MFHTTSIAVAAVLAFALFAGTAVAQDECVAMCRAEAEDCRMDARETHQMCLESNGCDLLRESYREQCLVADRDETTCAEAREDMKACLSPCRDALREVMPPCREIVEGCLVDVCDADPDEARHPFGRRDRH